MEKLTKLDELIREDGTLQTWSGAGGYSLTFLDNYGNVICDTCADFADRGLEQYLTLDDLQGAFIHWEGNPLHCDNCSEEIPSEYGEV